MRKKVLIIVILIGIIFLVSFMSRDNSLNEDGILRSGNPVDLVIATDLHFISQEIAVDGPLFSSVYLNSDGKQMNYISDITDAFIADVIKQKPHGLILSGDLTYNGEKKSHEDLAEKLEKVREAGIKVFVTPGNHDVSNYFAIGFEEESAYKVDHINRDEFIDLYGQFGLDQAIYKDEHSLSYVSPISEDLWIMMLDTNKYELNNSFFPSLGSGKVREGTVEWLESVLIEAEEIGITPITVMHHNLFNHNDRFDQGYTIDNSEEVLDLLNRFKVRLNLSGHIHIQHIGNMVSENNNIYDIVTSAFSVYPNQYGKITFTPDEEITYETQSTNVEKWAKDKRLENEDLLQFKEYSYDFFYDSSFRRSMRRLEESDFNDKEKAAMADTFALFNQYYFPGTLHLGKEEILNSEGYKLWEGMGENSTLNYFNSALLQPIKDETRVTIDLK